MHAQILIDLILDIDLIFNIDLILDTFQIYVKLLYHLYLTY